MYTLHNIYTHLVSTPILMIMSTISEVSNVKEDISLQLVYKLNYAGIVAKLHSEGYEATSIAPLELHDTSVHCSYTLTHHNEHPQLNNIFHT